MSTLVQNKVGSSKLKQNKGFSLVELMVVVAIIGILSAVAVPSVNKYMAKARQTEAKANLSMYYGANKVFHTEYGIFDTNFTTIGFKPEGRMRYNVGHTTAGLNIAQLGTYGYTAPAVLFVGVNSGVYCDTPAGVSRYAQAGCRMTADAAPLPSTGGCAPLPAAAGPMTTIFTACAAGRITNRAGIWDSWSITQNKTLTNNRDGTE